MKTTEEIYFEIFEGLPRQGPGDDKTTEKEFLKLVDLPQEPKIIDMGCGTGAQTLVLAKLSSGKITALDNHAPFIEKLRGSVNQSGLSNQIQYIIGDMTNIGLFKGKYDLIWSEGAAYNMGFENAINLWAKLLNPGGYLVASELVWFKIDGPKEIKDYFTKEYPDIKYFEELYPVIRSAGYEILDYLPLPSQSWWTDYYSPAEKKLTEMRKIYSNNKEAQSLFDSFDLEMEMHRKHSKYYGYGFYIMRKL